ncbi:MAG: sec-independent protein translocase protein TatA [Bacteroidia bacterium]|jgi:sec-independent protein translocase protein TatA
MELLECSPHLGGASFLPKSPTRSLRRHPLGLYIMDAMTASTSALQLFLGMPGFSELWPILAIVLLLFGGRKLPELARSMGSSITQFRKGLKDAEIEVEDSTQLEADSEKGDASSKD